ncbi:response regulator [Myxococcota bacterium]|nr:response regulator [Myxococcota bacterium]MBU1537024.1 response regulator [Myxococcota bacterium]
MTKILLVEDNEILAECTEINLERNIQEAKIYLARTISMAGEFLEVIRPDVAILDCNLSDGDGLSLVNPILEKNPLCHLIVTSGMLSPNYEEQIRDMGVHSVLVKPFELAELNQIISQRISNQVVLGESRFGTAGGISPLIKVTEAERVTHGIMNKLSSLMTGLRLLQLEIDEDLQGVPESKQAIGANIERMIGVIKETSLTIRNSFGGDNGRA